MLIFLSFSFMSVSLKGGNKAVVNMGDFGREAVKGIAVLHRECGSSGKTSQLISACCCRFHVFAFQSPQRVICLRSHR